MACLARNDLDRLGLVAPFGLWLDEHPIPDPFAVLPYQLDRAALRRSGQQPAKLLSGDVDLESNEGLAEFMVANARRLGTAGKIMFPIPEPPTVEAALPADRADAG